MSKQKANVPATKPESKALAAAGSAAVPAFLQEKMKTDAGKGVSSLAEDNLVPLIYIGQAMSPWCNDRKPDYITGARPGCLLLRGYSEPVIDGEEGFLFQPCFFYKDIVEWVPNRGGYVGRHETWPEDTEDYPNPKNPNSILKRRKSNGNDLVETRYHAGFVVLEDGVALPYVIPFSSTGHTTSRQWMFNMNSKQVAGSVAPSFACFYRVTTKMKSKGNDSWFALDIKDAGWVDTEAYERGEKLHNAFASGEKKADAPMEQEPAGGNADDAM